MKAKNFKDLVVWQKSHQFVLEIYKITRDFPPSEQFGFTSQLRRATVSVPGNIAEGFKRRGAADKARFLNISQASLEEVRYYLILAKDLGYAQTDYVLEELDEIGKMLNRYVAAVKAEKM